MENIIQQFCNSSKLSLVEINKYLNDKIKAATKAGKMEFYIMNKQFLIDIVTKAGYLVKKDHKDGMKTVSFEIPDQSTDAAIISASEAHSMTLDTRNELNQMLKQEIVEIMNKNPTYVKDNMFDMVYTYQSQHDLTREGIWGGFSGTVLNEIINEINQNSIHLTWDYNNRNNLLTITLEKIIL